MSIVRVGTTKKYAEGWEAIFGRRKGTAKPAAAKRAPKKGGKRKK